MDCGYDAPHNVIESETCGVLVGLLGQLADLVDHSAVIFSGLHDQVHQYIMMYKRHPISGLLASIVIAFLQESRCNC